MHVFFQFNSFRIWCPPNWIGICSSSFGCFMLCFAWKEIPNHGWMDMSTNHVEQDFNHPSSQ
jgi:hypothetical protein